MQGLQKSQEQPEASAQGEDASQQGAVASAGDLAEASGDQWLHGEEDGASMEAVHGSAEDGEERDRSRNASGVVSRAAVGHSQQEGEHEQMDYHWDDEVRHAMLWLFKWSWPLKLQLPRPDALLKAHEPQGKYGMENLLVISSSTMSCVGGVCKCARRRTGLWLHAH